MKGNRWLRGILIAIVTIALFGSCTTVEFELRSSPEPEVYENPWILTAGDFSKQIGERITLTLPPKGEGGDAWGTDIYTEDSNIGFAAVHSSLISFEKGGTVVIEIRPGQEAYEGSTRNGVTTQSYGEWESSFVFIDK